MKLLLVRHLWGVEGAWEQVFPQFHEAGYRAIEVPRARARRPQAAPRPLARHGFAYIPQIFTRGGTPGEHLESFRSQVAEAAELGPRLINSHSGRDGFTEAESERFFAEALRIEAECGVPVAHETHRGRILFHPWIAGRLLARFGELKLCCDFSHWVCVCERLLDDETAILRQCAARCIHLHARVGYEEGAAGSRSPRGGISAAPGGA